VCGSVTLIIRCSAKAVAASAAAVRSWSLWGSGGDFALPSTTDLSVFKSPGCSSRTAIQADSSSRTVRASPSRRYLVEPVGRRPAASHVGRDQSPHPVSLKSLNRIKSPGASAHNYTDHLGVACPVHDGRFAASSPNRHWRLVPPSTLRCLALPRGRGARWPPATPR